MDDAEALKKMWERVLRSSDWGLASRTLMRGGRWTMAEPFLTLLLPEQSIPAELAAVSVRVGIARADHLGGGRYRVSASFNPERGTWHHIGRIN